MDNAETEMHLLLSDLNPDDYAVLPSVSSIKSFGNTVVNSFYTSASDKLILNHFNKQELSAFGGRSVIKSAVMEQDGGEYKLYAGYYELYITKHELTKPRVLIGEYGTLEDATFAAEEYDEDARIIYDK